MVGNQKRQHFYLRLGVDGGEKLVGRFERRVLGSHQLLEKNSELLGGVVGVVLRSIWKDGIVCAKRADNHLDGLIADMSMQLESVRLGVGARAREVGRGRMSVAMYFINDNEKKTKGKTNTKETKINKNKHTHKNKKTHLSGGMESTLAIS